MQGIKYVQVWSGWLRLAHILLAVDLLFVLFSGWLIGNVNSGYDFWLDWHVIAGQFLLIPLLLRMGLLFVSGTSHWSNLLIKKSQMAAIGAVLKSYFSLGRFPLPNWYSYNPLWQLIYPLFYLVLILAMISGVLYGARFAGVISTVSLHSFSASFILYFTVFHLVSVFFHDWKGRGAYASSIFSGGRYFHVESQEKAEEAPKTAYVSIDALRMK